MYEVSVISSEICIYLNKANGCGSALNIRQYNFRRKLTHAARWELFISKYRAD